MGILQQVEGIAEPLVAEEPVAGDGVGVVGVKELGLVRLGRLCLFGDLFDPLVVD